jgi:hypothetical protein
LNSLEEEKFALKQEKERLRQAFLKMDDAEYLEHERNQIKEAIANRNKPEVKRPATQAFERLAETTPLESLKKMIENSKTLDRIHILETQKSLADGKKTLKRNFVDNYVPHDPIAAPMSATHSSRNWKLKFNRGRLLFYFS